MEGVEEPVSRARCHKALTHTVARLNRDLGMVGERGQDLLLLLPQPDVQPVATEGDRIGAVVAERLIRARRLVQAVAERVEERVARGAPHGHERRSPGQRTGSHRAPRP